MKSRTRHIVAGKRSGFDWYQQVASIIEHIDMPTLPDVLVQSIREVVPFEHAVTFGYAAGKRPVFLHDAFSNSQKESTIAPYLKGTYLLDPFYHACNDKIESGLYRMRDLAPDEFYEQVGAHQDYISPCVSDEPGFLSEEIGYFSVTESGTYIVFSLMRPHDAPPFSSAEFAWLHKIEPVVISVMARHWHDLGTGETDLFSPACLNELIEQKFNTFGKSILTPREQETSRLVLQGHSTDSISQRLEISKDTVKIHRKNIYSKLNISSQSELFSLFINLLSVNGPIS